MSHYLNYRGDHAVVLFPGTATAKEGDEENHHTDCDEKDGNSWGWYIFDPDVFVHTQLNQDSHDN